MVGFVVIREARNGLCVTGAAVYSSSDFGRTVMKNPEGGTVAAGASNGAARAPLQTKDPNQLPKKATRKAKHDWNTMELSNVPCAAIPSFLFRLSPLR